MSLTITIAFQNCAESLPEMEEQTSQSPPTGNAQEFGPGAVNPTGPGPVVAAPVMLAPLSLNLPKADLEPGGRQTVQASGGKTPYVYSIVSGPAQINASSGEMLAGATLGGVTVRVTDNAGTILDKSMSVGAGYAASVTSGSMTFSTPGNHSFSIPKYVRLNVQVRGAGGGGGGSNIDIYGGSAGGAGAGSSAFGISAPGGPGGQGSNYYAGVNYYPNSDASPAGNGGGAPGGQGGIYGLTKGQNGGTGGQAAAQFVIGQGGSPAVGNVIAVSVGAGGGGGINGTFFSATNAGSNGSVTISWGP